MCATCQAYCVMTSSSVAGIHAPAGRRSHPSPSANSAAAARMPPNLGVSAPFSTPVTPVTGLRGRRGAYISMWALTVIILALALIGLKFQTRAEDAEEGLIK